MSEEVASINDAFATAAADRRLSDIALRWQLKEVRSWQNLYRVVVTSDDAHPFRIWKDVSYFPEYESIALYIVPKYHPFFDDTKHSVGLINGDTDALIRGEAVHYVYAPGAKTAKTRGHGSWQNGEHPYYSTGVELELDINANLLCDPIGVKELADILVAALDLGTTYVSVSGGFDGNLAHPDEVARRMGIQPKTRTGRARGSEGHCAWAYATLLREGALEGAYIPRWFSEENWYGAYMVYSQVQQTHRPR